MEEWRPVVGFEGYYEVSNHGRVRTVEHYARKGHGGTRRLVKSRIRKAFPAYGGHLGLILSRGPERIRGRVHVMVALAFLGPRPEGLDVCHNNGNPTDNRVENLRYDTKSSNMYDKQKHGTDHYACRNHCSAGHEYTSDNTRIRVRDGHISRVCRQCEKEASVKKRAKRKQESDSKLRADATIADGA